MYYYITLIILHNMNSKYVMANLTVPLEIQENGTINPMTNMTVTRVMYIIKSIDDICIEPNDALNIQIAEIFKLESNNENINSSDDNINNLIEPKMEIIPSIMSVLKVDCNRRSHKKTNNCSFKKTHVPTTHYSKTIKKYSTI